MAPLSADTRPLDRLGRPLRDLRISVTDRCNFRCPYCMPAEIYGDKYEFLARPELLSFEEIERLARLFVEQGVEKILLEEVPQITKVMDITDHASGTNPYYQPAK